MSLYLLDTNMVSYIVHDASPAARAKLDSLAADDVVSISAITEGEKLFGVAKSPNEKRLKALEAFLNALVVYPWGRDTAAIYGPLRAQQERLGKPLGPYDMQIAAQAVAVGAILVSHDRAFQAVPNLRVEDWAIDIPSKAQQ